MPRWLCRWREQKQISTPKSEDFIKYQKKTDSAPNSEYEIPKVFNEKIFNFNFMGSKFIS